VPGITVAVDPKVVPEAVNGFHDTANRAVPGAHRLGRVVELRHPGGSLAPARTLLGESFVVSVLFFVALA